MGWRRLARAGRPGARAAEALRPRTASERTGGGVQPAAVPAQTPSLEPGREPLSTCRDAALRFPVVPGLPRRAKLRSQHPWGATMRARLCLAISIAALATACGARTGLPSTDAEASGDIDEDGGRGGAGGDNRLRADKIDLLFVIDNSASMVDKQTILASAIPDLVNRLVNPACVDDAGQPVGQPPPTPTAPCPAGLRREFNALQDMHIGVISTSLGGHGADNCSPALGDGYNETMDDHAHLTTRGPGGSSVVTYENEGFLAWDPAATKDPPGESNLAAVKQRLADLVVGVGERGCGAEAPLEAWYRFLVDPDPPAAIVRVDCAPGSGDLACAELQGTDATLLAQRADFLRPDSMVAVVMLTDENDCSIVDGGRNWQVLQVLEPDGATAYTNPRPTSTCATAPNDPCCHSCATPSPTGCPPTASDPECQKGKYVFAEDPGNLRCFHQKQRYGASYLRPIERYVRGLTEDAVPDRKGDLVASPLFTAPDGRKRPKSLVFLAGIVGVPWQDVAVDPEDPDDLVYKTAKELHATGGWDLLVGDPEHGVAPLDPLMIESLEPRTGVHPVTGDPLAPPSATSPTANPINGHEYIEATIRDELQYACIFELPEPRDCAFETDHCDCATDALPQPKPICQDESGAYGTVQYRAKAYPATRQLEVLRGIGDNAIVSSICARNVTDPSRPDYGYRPALGAILARLRGGLK